MRDGKRWGANQSDNLMRSGTSLIQQGLPYLSLSCNIILNYTRIQSQQIAEFCNKLYLHKWTGAPSNGSSPSKILQWLSPQQSLADDKNISLGQFRYALDKFTKKLAFTSGSSSSLRGVLSVLRRSLTASLYISIAENFKTNALSSCWNNDNNFYVNKVYKQGYLWSVKLPMEQTHNNWNFYYLMYIVKYVCYCILCYSNHGICLSTACLPICKNTRWKYKMVQTFHLLLSNRWLRGNR